MAAIREVTNMDLEELEPLVDSPSPPPTPHNKGDDKQNKQLRSTRSSSVVLVPHVGILMAIASAFFFSISSLIIKVMFDVNAVQVTFFRYASLMVQTLPLLVWSGEPVIPRGYCCLMVIRAVMGVAAGLVQFYAIQHMPLGDASVIIFSSPVFCSVFARFSLGEPCGILESSVIVLTAVGIICMVRPPFLFGSLSDVYTTEYWLGMAAAIMGSILSAVIHVIMRMVKNLNYSVVMFNTYALAIMLISIIAYFNNYICVPQYGKTRYLIVFMGVLAFLDQILFTKALQLEQAGPVSNTRATEVIFAFIWQAVFFNQFPGVLTLLGAVLVSVGVLLLGLCR